MTITLLSSPPDLSNLVVRHSQNDVQLKVSPPLAGASGGIVGQLYVCESLLYFYSATANAGIAVEYPDIIIHAISRQNGEPAIYCQLDEGLFFPNQQLPEDESTEDIVTELSFTPSDIESMENIYMAMSECAALHPDEEFLAEQRQYDDDNEHEFYANPSDETELNEVQQAALRHLESVFEAPTPPNGNEKNDQFEDAMDEKQ